MSVCVCVFMQFLYLNGTLFCGVSKALEILIHLLFQADARKQCTALKMKSEFHTHL